MTARIRLLVLVGATAGGKTGLAVDVAHSLGSEIISADSRQIYRGLDLGSGKDLDEYARVTPPEAAPPETLPDGSAGTTPADAEPG